MNWQAKWIWAKQHRDTPNCYIYARRAVDLDALPDATLHITCSSHYKLYVNGRYVGQGPAEGGPPHQVYDRHELKRYIRPGPNVIGAICYNIGESRPAGLLAQLTTSQTPDPILVTDGSWRVLVARDWDFNSHRISPKAGYQEIYDSRLKPVGWNVVGFDDSTWDEPDIAGDAGSEPWGSLIERLIPNLIETECSPTEVINWGRLADIDGAHFDPATRIYNESIQPDPKCVKGTKDLLRPGTAGATITPGGDVSIVLDFGRELTGSPAFSVIDGVSAVVDIGYSESLDRQGNVYPTRDRIKQGDRVILHGGRQEWQSFGRRTFRFIQLTFRHFQSPIILRDVRVRTIGYPTRQLWTFECSDDLLNEIHKLGIHTLNLCMQDSYQRDPLRDPSPHPADARIQALINYYTFSDYALAESDIRRFARELVNLPPTQSLGWIVMLHDYYLHTGDRQLIEDVYPYLWQLLDRILSHESPNGLLATSGIELATWNAAYHRALRDASKLALAIQNYDDTQLWHNRAQRVLSAFNESFWNDSMSSYTSTSRSLTPSALANVLAVTCGLTTSDRCSQLGDFVRASALKLGPSLAHYTLGAMAALDMVSDALDMIRAGWGRMLECGATSCWSRFPDPGDTWRFPPGLCRGRSAAPTAFLVSEVLGIKPSAPTSPVAIVQPRPGGLTWARGGYDLPTGRLWVHWTRSEQEFNMEIDAPDGFIAAIPVDAFQNPVIHEIDLTPETPERRARKTYGWGDIIWRSGEERDPYLDWLDSQEATPPEHYHPKTRCSLDGQYVWIREPISLHARYIVHEE